MCQCCPQLGRAFGKAFRSSGLLTDPIDVACGGVGVPLLLTIFTFATPLQLKPRPIQNLVCRLMIQLEEPGAIAGRVRLKFSLSASEGLVIVWKWCCSTNTGSGSCHCVWDVVEWH